MSGTSTTLPSTTAAGISQIEDLKFGITDYTVFVLMLSVSAGIGVYFGFFAKAKNTTDEYLRGGKKMQALPIAISLVSRFVYILFYLVIGLYECDRYVTAEHELCTLSLQTTLL